MKKKSAAADKRKFAEPLSAKVSFTLVTLMLLLLASAVIGVFPAARGLWPHWTSRIVAIIAAAAILALYTYRRYVLPMRASHQPTVIWPLPDDQINVIRRSAGIAGVRGGPLNARQLGDIQAKVFAFAVLKPEMVRMRLTERYEPGQRTLTRRVSIDAQIPTRMLSRPKPPKADEPPARDAVEPSVAKALVAAYPGDGGLFFPVLVPSKGELVNDLRVFNGDGAQLPLLSYSKYLELVAQVLRTLLCIAYQVEEIKESEHADAFEAEKLALRGIMRRGSEGVDLAGNPDHSGYRAMMGLDGVRNDAARKLAAQLVQRLTSNYAVVAAVNVPEDGRFVISFDEVTVPKLESHAGKLKQNPRPSAAGQQWGNLGGTFKYGLRLMFGARPVEVKVKLEDAASCQSYHLIIDGQEGIYVGEQEAEGLVEYFQAHVDRLELERARKANITTPPPYYRFLRRTGQRYAHFYARFFPRPIPNLANGSVVPEVKFKFYEMPPGSTFRAMLASIAATILIWIVGFVLTQSKLPETDAPAFLLVFPAIVAGWLGFEGRTHRLLEGTLAARLSLIVTAFSSVGASALCMTHKDGVDPGFIGAKVPLIHVPGIETLGWSILILISLMNTCCITYTYLRRSWEFAHLAGRD